jgi:predicted ATP-grasp superfamily ATP-dependent carboligase
VNRFDYVNDLLVDILEKKYHKTFKPIYIYSCDPAPEYKKDNFLVVNKELPDYQNVLNTRRVIYGQEYEDLNLEVSESLEIQSIINRLSDKQDKIFYISFTSSFLNLKHPKIVVIGPKQEIATKFDNKLEQYKLFKNLGLPVINYREYSNIESIEKNEKYPFFLTSLYTSGGCESSVIKDGSSLDEFYKNLREINKKGHLVASDYISDISIAPNTNAIVVSECDVRIISVTDQVLYGNEYLGNIYPSLVSEAINKKICDITNKVGIHLGQLGYRGIFGCDFIIDQNENVYINDLNPRRQGGYLCNLLLSKKVNLLEQELLLVLGEDVTDFNHEDFKVDYAWGHSKIKLHYSAIDMNLNQYRTLLRPNNNSAFVEVFDKIGTEYTTTFYPKGYILTGGYPGYYAVSDFDRKIVEDKVKNMPESLLNDMTTH